MTVVNDNNKTYQESRVKKTLLNVRINLIFYFLTLILSFFSRKVFLNYLGANFLGLTTTLQNLLGLLNLAELGVGTAIAYVLYKPLFDNDRDKINEIISVMGYLYRWIGTIILLSGCILSFFLPKIFPVSETNLPLSIVYLTYYAFLTSSLIGYYINYRQNLLSADQKNYVVTAYFQSCNLIKIVIQIVLAYYTKNLFFWVLIEFTFGIIYSFVLNYRIHQVYPWLKTTVSRGRNLLKKYPDIKVKTQQLFVHKIGAVVQQQATPFLIYAFVNISTVAYYGNYTIIVSKINQLVSNFLGSTDAGVGNLIAEGNKEKILRVYWELMAIRFFVASTVIFVLYKATNAFIVLWLGASYLLPLSILVLILISTFVGMIRGTTDQFVYGYGLFKDIWAPIAESVIFLLTSIVCGHFWGLSGVLIGSVISLLVIVGIWKPYFLFMNGFHTNIFVYWKHFLKYLLTSIICLWFCSWLSDELISFQPSESFKHLISYSLLILLIYIPIFLTITYILTRGTRDFVKRFINYKQ